MKIIVISQSDISGGAARAAYRVSSQMIEMKLDLKMQVMQKSGRNSWVIYPKEYVKYILSRIIPRLELWVKKFLGVKNDYPWTLNLFPNFFLNKHFINSFDIIHLQWIGKCMVPIDWIKNISKPVVWTLHDSWPFTGGCQIPSECRGFEIKCGFCPQLSTHREQDLSRTIWTKKFNSYKNIKFHIVAPSNWMAEQARSSSLLKNFPITVIPNGLDIFTFSQKNKVASRIEMNIPQNKIIILFGAMNADKDKNKGIDLLLEALVNLRNSNSCLIENYCLVVFGSTTKLDSYFSPMHVVNAGVISDNDKLAFLYSAADLTIVPSRSESFGQVALESLACSTPVVAFNSTGLKDIVDHLVTGYLAEPYNAVDLAKGIMSVTACPEKYLQMSICARVQAVKRFDIKLISKKYLDLYKSIVYNKGL